MNNFPVITAHTGCMDTPANTILSLVRGLESEADMCEVDVRSTKDGVAVLMHDYTVVDCSGREFNVYELTIDELTDIKKKLKKDSEACKVARLDEALELTRSYNKRLNLDLKGPTPAAAMIKAVKEAKMLESVVISGCHFEQAHYMKSLFPEVEFYLNADEFKTVDLMNRMNCYNAVLAKCYGINLQFRSCNPELVKMANERSLMISVWTVDTPNDMKSMIEMGVDSITTRNVDALVNLKKTILKG